MVVLLQNDLSRLQRSCKVGGVSMSETLVGEFVSGLKMIPKCQSFPLLNA